MRLSRAECPPQHNRKCPGWGKAISPSIPPHSPPRGLVPQLTEGSQAHPRLPVPIQPESGGQVARPLTLGDSKVRIFGRGLLPRGSLEPKRLGNVQLRWVQRSLPAGLVRAFGSLTGPGTSRWSLCLAPLISKSTLRRRDGHAPELRPPPGCRGLRVGTHVPLGSRRHGPGREPPATSGGVLPLYWLRWR